MEKKKLIPINKPIIQRIVSSGRITIPNEMREIYKLEDGDLMEILVIGYYKGDNNGGEGNESKRGSKTG